jgi:uncharacterized membrane protein
MNTDNQTTLTALQGEFPAFRITRETTLQGPRYIVRSLRLSQHPHTLITADPAELRAALAPAHSQDPAVSPPAAGMNAATLPPAQREALRQALADAIRYRDPPLRCRQCDKLASLCNPCSAGLAQASAYLSLSRELGFTSPPDSHRDGLTGPATH